MPWSFRIARIAGIEVRIHITFLMLLAWIGIADYTRGGMGAAVNGVAFILLLFGCVVLHEFGHALAAKHYGIQTPDITLLPIGGVARLERIPESPRQELWIALAGPAVNVVIAALLALWLGATGQLAALATFDPVEGSFAARLLAVNLFLVAFNLLPAFPMDGGRVLRAVLAMRLNHARATRIAANVGQGMAIVFGVLGLFGNPMLILIALFVWIGAAQEASLVQMKSSFAGIPVRRAMVTEFEALAPGDPLQRAVDLVLRGFQQDFPVIDRDRVVGILTRGALIQALSTDGPQASVERRMTREFETAQASEMLEPAFARLQACGCHTAIVTHEGRVAGLLTMDNLGEFVLIQAAMPSRRRSAGGGA